MLLNKWRLIDTGVGSASYNMAVDEALLENFKVDSLPILRLYRWEDSLSFGRYSDVKKSVNLELLFKKNLSYTRRMTGGGVLIHGGDLSYSLLLPKEILKEFGVKESYRYLCAFLINFYKKLGLHAEFAQELKLENAKSNICMASNEAYDIVIDGKKIGGNAQRHTKTVLFQHGSVPLSLKDELFEELFLEDAGLDRVAILDRIIEKMTCERLTLSLIEAFGETFDATFAAGGLSPLERSSADELLKRKYTQKGWNIDAK